MIDEKAIEDYVDQVTAGNILNVSQGRISQLCSQGRFQGAMKIGWSWIIPKEAVENFQRRRRGPRPKTPQNEIDKEFLAEVVNQANNLREEEVPS